jgi:hypothetical protein
LYTNQAGGLGKSRGRKERDFQANRAGGWEIVCFAGKNLRKVSVLKYIYFFKTFYKIWSVSPVNL